MGVCSCRLYLGKGVPCSCRLYLGKGGVSSGAFTSVCLRPRVQYSCNRRRALNSTLHPAIFLEMVKFLDLGVLHFSLVLPRVSHVGPPRPSGEFKVLGRWQSWMRNKMQMHLYIPWVCRHTCLNNKTCMQIRPADATSRPPMSASSPPLRSAVTDLRPVSWCSGTERNKRRCLLVKEVWAIM